jgi:signal transduction histidine kinase
MVVVARWVGRPDADRPSVTAATLPQFVASDGPQERLDRRDDPFRSLPGAAVTDAVEFDEPTSGEVLVDVACALAEEVRPLGAGQDERRGVDGQAIGQSVALDGPVHADDLLGERDALGPDVPLRQPGVEVVDAVRVEHLLDVAFHGLPAAAGREERRHAVGEIRLLPVPFGEDGGFVGHGGRDGRLDRGERAEGVAEQDRLAVDGVDQRPDATKRERRERQLQRQTEHFDEVATFVSHDLQTPVATVRGRLALALETGDPEHVRRAEAAIERVDDLRTNLVETLRTGQLVSTTERVDVGAALRQIWSAIDPPDSTTCVVEEGTHVTADADAFKRLLENLVGNSIEHGGSDVDIRIGPLAEGLYYEDDGPGVPPEQRERVFSPGFSTKPDGDGTGLGLASVRQIVLAHGWRIDVDDADRLDGVRFEIRDQ